MEPSGLFDRIFKALAGKTGQSDRLMIDATHLKAHRTAASLLKKALSRCIGRTKGSLNSKLHAVTDGLRRPLLFFLTAGQASDYKGAWHLLDRLPKAKELLADVVMTLTGFAKD